MKISKSKQELARIISENGGWRDGARWATQDHVIAFFSGGKPDYAACDKVWYANGDDGVFIVAMSVDEKIKGFHNTILSSAEYFHLYPSPDADGWAGWKGGECPVKTGELVDIRYRDGEEVFGAVANEGDSDAGAAFWSCDDFQCDIIAYRLHKQQSKPEFCESVMRSIPDPDEQVWTNPPSIEQLAADYRNAKDFAEHKQQEADDAKADAEVKLAELVATGKALGLVLSVAGVEPELVIHDWRDLQVVDIIECIGSWEREDTDGRRFAVTAIDPRKAQVGKPIRIEVPEVSCPGTWGLDFKFIRRP